MDEPQNLFPALPESLDALTDEQLQSLLSDSLSAKDRIVAQDAEFLGDRTASDVLAEMKAGVDGILRLKAEQASRVEAETNLASELAALNAQVEPEPEAAAADADTADGELNADEPLEADEAEAAAADAAAAIDEPAPAVEPVVAAAPPIRRRMPAAGRHNVITADRGGMDGMTLVASGGLTGVKEGVDLDREGLALAIRAAARSKVATLPGMIDHVVVASAQIEMPEYRRLVSGDVDGNARKVEALTAAASRSGVTFGDHDWAEAEALTASGGICAPVTPYYQLANVSTVQRPVRDGLVGFVADRGGIQFAPPPVLGDITTAVGIITADQDAAGGSAGTKSCQTIICPDFTEVDVDSIYHCITAGNLGARAFPEQVAQFNALVLAAHARLAETNLLNAIKAGSTAVTANGQAVHNDGAAATLLNDILVAAAGIRSRNRMMKDARLQAILPAWTADMLVGDLVASQFNRFAYNQAGVEQLLNSFNVQISWTLDGPSTGTAQVFGTQGASAVIGYPTAVQWALFPAGSWLFVDSGVLELGIVRDSVLNATNSYQIFGESWENAAGIGVESLWITSTVCPSGIVSAATAPAGC